MKSDLFVIWQNIPDPPTMPHAWDGKTGKTLCGLTPVGYYDYLTKKELPTKADTRKSGFWWQARLCGNCKRIRRAKR